MPELVEGFNILSGISSRPLSLEAMIALCFAEDHAPRVRDLVCVVEAVVRLSEDGRSRCPVRCKFGILWFCGYQGTRL